ncbi:MAG: cytochrome c [Hyphomicrobiaceae bacterium]|nr:cytochrome c [Hyphomicrobiaceae bacterium]MCC0010790.1 cytochrome c [Hyphomicrobiaceae bacterium]
MHRAPLFLTAMLAAMPVSTALADEVSQQRAAELRHLVLQDCGSCHGMTLKGGLGPDIRPQQLSGRDRKTIATIILDGVPGKPMPPWRGLLSDADALWIAQYLLEGSRQ